MLSVEWEESGFQHERISDHFVDINKSIPVPKGGLQIIEDLLLTQYAGYLIAQCGDPCKEKIAIPGVFS